MKFLIDAQLPPSLARWIERQGHHAKHIFEIGLERGKDGPIWEQARNDNAAIITKDEDFADRWLLSDRWYHSSGFERATAQIGRCWHGSSRYGQTH